MFPFNAKICVLVEPEDVHLFAEQGHTSVVLPEACPVAVECLISEDYIQMSIRCFSVLSMYTQVIGLADTVSNQHLSRMGRWAVRTVRASAAALGPGAVPSTGLGGTLAPWACGHPRNWRRHGLGEGGWDLKY